MFKAYVGSLDFFCCYLYRFTLVTHNIKLLSSYYFLNKKTKQDHSMRTAC